MCFAVWLVMLDLVCLGVGLIGCGAYTKVLVCGFGVVGVLVGACSLFWWLIYLVACLVVYLL